MEEEVLQHFLNNVTTSTRAAANVLHPIHGRRVLALNEEDGPCRVEFVM